MTGARTPAASGHARLACVAAVALLAGGCALLRGEDPLDARNVMHPDADVRRQTVESLGRKAVPEAVPVLTDRLLKDPDPLVRAQAARSLGRLGYREAVPYLVEGLKDTHSVVRWDACAALGEMREPASLGPVIAVLRSDDSTDVKRMAAQTLGKLGDERAIPPLIAATGDAEPGVAKAAAVSLLTITSQSFGADRAAWEKWWEGQPPARRSAAEEAAPGPAAGEGAPAPASGEGPTTPGSGEGAPAPAAESPAGTAPAQPKNP